MMLHQHTPMHRDPFHFSSSSPDRLTTRPYVATRPNPYTVKSQNTQFYTSLRSTAQPTPIDPRLNTLSAVSKDFASPLDRRGADNHYSSLEAASRSPPCSSKPQTTSDRPYPLLTMVKPKPRSVKALTLSAELTAAKRLGSNKVASAAAEKRRKNVVEAAKQHTRGATSPLTRTTSSRGRSRSPSLAQLSPRSTPSPPKQASPPRNRLQVPDITFRSPTPEPEPEIPLEGLLQSRANCDDGSKGKSQPLYSTSLLSDLRADLAKSEDGIDAILSKYFDSCKDALVISVEMLRFLTASISTLYSFVQDPESELGQAKILAVSSKLFTHTVTGFFHLLDDPLAPYAVASSLAFVSAKIVQDLDKAIGRYCSFINVPARVQQQVDHGQLFLNVLNDELQKILDRGIALINSQNRLRLPEKESTSHQKVSIGADLDDYGFTCLPGGKAWEERIELRKQKAQDGHAHDQFVGIDVVRFIGELVNHKVIEASIVSRWLDRFLVQTAYLGIPSAWEIECACALLITVGATLDLKSDAAQPSSAITSLDAEQKAAKVSCSSSPKEDIDCSLTAKKEHNVGFQVLQKAMDRVDFLVSNAEISLSAREWLIEVGQMRERGWAREDDLDSLDDYLNGDELE